MRVKAEKPDPELLKLIELVNVAPRKPMLPNSKYLIAKNYFEKTGKVFPRTQFGMDYSLRDSSIYPKAEEITLYRKAQDEALDEAKKITKKFPLLYRYVFDKNEETIYNIEGNPDRFQQLSRYDGIIENQQLLTHIAISCSVFIEKFGFKTFSENCYPISASFETIIPLNLSFEYGKLVFNGFDIRGMLQKCDIRRLRWCKTCKSIFWAYRLDVKYCSNKCGNLFRVRKSIAEKEENERLKNELRKMQKNQDFSINSRKK